MGERGMGRGRGEVRREGSALANLAALLLVSVTPFVALAVLAWVVQMMG